jgi:hypothetical protein
MTSFDDADYYALKADYERSQMVCDPIEYVKRQKALLDNIALYLIHRDAPDQDSEDDDE